MNGIRVTVIPIGDMEDVIPALEPLAPGMVFEITGPRDPPERGYASDRQQYRGQAFLDDIRSLGYPRTLALTDLNLYEPDLDFIFGLAEKRGRACVVSTAKLHHTNRKIFHERVRKEVVHELGHTLGLSHCRSQGCVMRFSKRLADIDAKGERFCQACAKRLGENLLEDAGVHQD